MESEVLKVLKGSSSLELESKDVKNVESKGSFSLELESNGVRQVARLAKVNEGLFPNYKDPLEPEDRLNTK